MSDDKRMNKELARLDELVHARRLSRRQLMKGLASLGISGAAAAWMIRQAPWSVKRAWAAAGDTPEERAINAVKALAPKAKKKTISILHPSGSAGNMAPFTAEWKKLTGFDVELIEAPLTQMHQKGMQEAVAKSGRYDLMLPAPISLPDFAESGVIRDISDWVAKYDPEEDHGPNRCPYPVSEFGNKYKGRWYGLFCDGDWWLLYMRKDKLEAAGAKVPNTWDEYDRLVKQMTKPDENFWGSLEYRSGFYAKWQWMQRFCSKGMVYFDENMEPLCDTPEGIQTAKELVALEPALPKEAWTNGWSENYNMFGQGHGFASFAWPSFYRYNNDPSISPAVAGKIEPAEIPGTVVNGELIRASIMPFAWDFVVDSYSEIPEIAYLYAQWITGPTMSMRSIPNKGGYFDPWRTNHFLHPSPKLAAAYPGKWLPTSYAAVSTVVPEFILRGAAEYSDALDKNFIAATLGHKSPEEAMKRAAKEMRRITRRLGKKSQIEAWRALAKGFPEKIKKAAGVDKWA